MKRAWLLIFAILFLAFAPPSANACGKVLARNACAAETLGVAQIPASDLAVLLPESFATIQTPTRVVLAEPAPRAPRAYPSPLQHEEVRARGVPYHVDSPPPYLLPSVSS